MPTSRTRFWKRFGKNHSAQAGLWLFAAVAAVAFVLPALYSVDAAVIVAQPLTAPLADRTVPLGTDYLGRDMLAALLSGGSITLLLGFATAALTVTVGAMLGAAAGYLGGWVDLFVVRAIEFFQVLPPLLFAMVIVALFSPSLPTIALAISVVNWPATARLTRAEFFQLKRREYVLAARAIGMTNVDIMRRVILPNAAPPIVVSIPFTIGATILFEAGLSFLGLSDPNVRTWGAIIGSNRVYFLSAWWGVTLPGLLIFATVLSINLIGDGLNDALAPAAASQT